MIAAEEDDDDAADDCRNSYQSYVCDLSWFQKNIFNANAISDSDKKTPQNIVSLEKSTNEQIISLYQLMIVLC